MKIVKCPKTGNVLKVMCENTESEEGVLIPNSTDASSEKHVPEIINNNGVATIRVNHIMEREHYIQWILVDYGNLEIIKYFKPFENPSFQTNYTREMKVYAYCNQHGLWVNENK